MNLLIALVVVLSPFIIEIDAGPGISGGILNFTYYLGDQKTCFEDDQCMSVCQEQASDPDAVVRSRCMKFVGNFSKYCCCYGKDTNACCQQGNSGLDCVPSS